MIDLLFGLGVTKLGISIVLAGVALAVQRRLDRPPVSHMLWLLVLVALLVPALVRVPVPWLAVGVERGAVAGALPVAELGGASGLVAAAVVDALRSGWVVVWLTGSAVLLVWSLGRAFRFGRLLERVSDPADAAVVTTAVGIARSIGLAGVPTIRTTRARLSPMVWWFGGRVRVLLPADLVAHIDREELRWVLAHELAHVRRNDHVVRWLEWLACVVFWWNPVVWWARRELRVAEEFCCDALVLCSLGPSPRTYGGSLVSVIDYLSTPAALRPPAFASAVDSGGRTTLIERRLRKIMGTRGEVTPRWFRLALGVSCAGALSLGLVYCGGDTETVAGVDESVQPPATAVTAVEQREVREIDARKARVERAVEEIRQALVAGEITKEEAGQRLERLKGVLGAAGVVRRLPSRTDGSASEMEFGAQQRMIEEKLRASVQSDEATLKEVTVGVLRKRDPSN